MKVDVPSYDDNLPTRTYSKVNAAAMEQMQKLCHTTNIYLFPKIHEYAERLTDTLPGDLKVNFWR